MKINKVLLVGGTGYVGRHLEAALSAKGCEVFVTGTSEKKIPNHFRIDFEDASSFRQLEEKKFDLIVVLASRINSLGTTSLDHADLAINTTCYADFLAFLEKNRVTEKLIYVSSMTVYSSSNIIPVKEDGLIAPQHTYGLSKAIAETITSFFCAQSNVSGIIFRIPGVYGGDRNSGFIYNTVKKMIQHQTVTLKTGGLVFWETIHVDDLTEMIVSFVEKYKWDKKFDVYNISYGMQTDFYETVSFIKKTIGTTELIEKETEKGYLPFNLSNEKIKQLIPVKEDYYGRLENYIKSIAG